MPVREVLEEYSQLTAFKELSAYTSLKAKRVLEIGGNSKCVSAVPFLEAGAESVTVSGVGHVNAADAPPRAGVVIVSADALSLVETFGENGFDVVYGISVLEHIPQPARLFAELYKILKPGGIAYVQGAPLWCGALGHHIWLDNWRHKTKKSYHFIPWPGSGSTNPIPDWGHLLYTPNELGEILRADGIIESDIPIILDCVYERDNINRETATSLARAASKSEFSVLALNTRRHVMPSETFEKLRSKYNATEDWAVHGITMILSKS